MVTIKTVYTGDLRTQATHVKSEEKIITDAPVDNKGKGEAFSPTDLLCASLGTCMMTTMGIAANTHQLNIEGLTMNITKIMVSNPRKVGEIIVEINFPSAHFSDSEKQILEKAALTCPVALSLNPDIKQTVDFKY